MLLQELQQCQMQDAYVWEYDITDDQDLRAERRVLCKRKSTSESTNIVHLHTHSLHSFLFIKLRKIQCGIIYLPFSIQSSANRPVINQTQENIPEKADS